MNSLKPHIKMTGILSFCILMLSLGCTTDNNPSNQPEKTIDNNEPFDIAFQIEKVNEGLYNLSVTLDLESGSYVVSPYSQDTIFGHFAISVTDIGNVVLGEELLEIPPSFAEIDPVINSPVRLVRGKTIYKQDVHVLTSGDFEASGLVWFVLEPSCVPYDVGFVISNNSGELTVKKTKTAISKGYGG